jgi:hypothetical protein
MRQNKVPAKKKPVLFVVCYSRPPKVQVPSCIDHIPQWITSGATILLSRKGWREGANNSNNFAHCNIKECQCFLTGSRSGSDF